MKFNDIIDLKYCKVWFNFNLIKTGHENTLLKSNWRIRVIKRDKGAVRPKYLHHHHCAKFSSFGWGRPMVQQVAPGAGRPAESG